MCAKNLLCDFPKIPLTQTFLRKLMIVWRMIFAEIQLEKRQLWRIVGRIRLSTGKDGLLLAKSSYSIPKNSLTGAIRWVNGPPSSLGG